MFKIAITGPESSGKTSICKALAAHFNAPYTQEYARGFLEKTQGIYFEKDLITIVEGQINLEKEKAKLNAPILFCDTDPLVIWIWSMVKFGKVDAIIDAYWKNHKYDLYLLVYPDIAWEYDPQRENENDREVLFDIYESKLKEVKANYHVLRGSHEGRLLMAIDFVQGFNI